MPTLYFDESGYSGSDLLEKKTPYYGSSALNISEERAQDLKRLHFPAKQAELKFKDLKKGPNFHRAYAMMETLLEENAVRVTVMNKSYVLTAKLFEWVAEPSLSGRMDLYSEGALPKLVSAFHTELLATQPDALALIQRSFMQAMNKQDDAAFAEFMTHLEALTGGPGEVARDLLLPPARQEGLRLVSDLKMKEGPLGILISAAWQNLLRWGHVIPAGTPIEVIYHRHSVLEVELELWNTMTATSLDMTSNAFGYTLRHPVTTSLGNAETLTALQLADVAAGFAELAVRYAEQHQAGQIKPSSLPQPGKRAFELLSDARFSDQKVLNLVLAGTGEQYTGWSIHRP